MLLITISKIKLDIVIRVYKPYCYNCGFIIGENKKEEDNEIYSPVLQQILSPIFTVLSL